MEMGEEPLMAMSEESLMGMSAEMSGTDEEAGLVNDDQDLMDLLQSEGDFSDIGDMLKADEDNVALSDDGMDGFGDFSLDEMMQSVAEEEEAEEDSKKRKKKDKNQKNNGKEASGFIQKLSQVLFGDDEDEETVPEYKFVRNSYGGPLQLNIEVPQVKFDYSFRILDEAVFAEDQNLPPGITYQIQLFGGSRKASLAELKGLSPVYEHRSPSGMYIYRVGRFSTYDEALSNILQVRNLGFRSAYLCAFDNGNEITVATARTRQERLKGGFELYEIRMVPDSGELDHRVVEFIMSTAVGKDIIRSEAEDGTQVFTVGPFDSKDAADTLVEAVQGMLAGKVTCEPIMN